MGKTYKEMTKKNVLKQRRIKKSRREVYEHKHLMLMSTPNNNDYVKP